MQAPYPVRRRPRVKRIARFLPAAAVFSLVGLSLIMVLALLDDARDGKIHRRLGRRSRQVELHRLGRRITLGQFERLGLGVGFGVSRSRLGWLQKLRTGRQ